MFRSNLDRAISFKKKPSQAGEGLRRFVFHWFPFGTSDNCKEKLKSNWQMKKYRKIIVNKKKLMAGLKMKFIIWIKDLSLI